MSIPDSTPCFSGTNTARPSLWAAGLVLLALLGFSVYEYNQSQRIAAAGAALAQAANDDDYRQVIGKYSGTVAAGDASLFLAGRLRDERKYGEAVDVLEAFLDKYPNHPLAAAGDLSLAETLEAQGKPDDALAKYQEVAAKYPDSYSAPVAVHRPGRISSSPRGRSTRPGGCTRTSWRSFRTASSRRRPWTRCACCAPPPRLPRGRRRCRRRRPAPRRRYCR